MTTENDYTLLRHFDLEAAKRGEAICDVARNYEVVTFAAEAGSDGNHAVRLPSMNIVFAKSSNLRMAPLAWVEGRPVYKGDVLYGKSSGRKYTADGSENTLDFTWTPPKPKTKQVKLLAYFDGTRLFWQSATSSFTCGWKRVPSEDKTIKVEG